MRVIHNVNAGRLGTWSTWRALGSLIHPRDRHLDREVLAAVGLDHTLLDVRVDELSGGQRQRVALARVLRQRPDLVLADEPVASLDPTLSALSLDLITSPPPDVAPPHGWTVIVSLHQPELARVYADRVVGLRGGQIVFDVASDELSDELLDRVYTR